MIAQGMKEIVRGGWTALLRAAPPKVSLEWVGLSLRSRPLGGDRQLLRDEAGYHNPPAAAIIGEPPNPPTSGYRSPAEYLIRLDGGYISKRSGVADRDGYTLREIACLTPHQREALDAYRAPLHLNRTRRLEGVTLALSTGQESNYFHWLFEVVCRYGMIEALNEHIDHVYVESRFPFQQASLRALGIDPRRIVSSHEASAVHCEAILAPSCLEAFWSPTDWMVEYLRQRFWKPAGSDAPHPKRIYITRQRSSYRRTRNEAQVIVLLEARGFEPVALEEHGLDAQAAIFRSAKVIVATHGAGLANLAFATPGAWVIELMPPRYCHWVYYNLAARAGCNYICVMGEGATDPSLWGYQKEDIEVDPAKLREALRVAGL